MNLEQKVDYIEGELGLMKGEIKQTLVDLREFIMKQGAPFAVTGTPPQATATQPQITMPQSQATEAQPQASAPQATSDGTPGAEGLPVIRTVSLSDGPPASQASAEPEAEQEDVGFSPGDIQRMMEEARAQGREEAGAELREEPNPRSSTSGPAAVQSPADALPQVQVVPSSSPTGQVPRNQAEAPAEQAAATQLPTDRETFPDFAALDANLLTNLTRWVGGVKRRLGADQLGGLLEIYKLTGHLPPVVEKLIYFLAGLEALPDESSDQVFTLDDLMDSLLQLHAVVYGPGYAARGSLLGLEERLLEVTE